MSAVSGSRGAGSKKIELSSAVFVTRRVASRLMHLGVWLLDGHDAGVHHGGSKGGQVGDGENATGVMVTG